MRKNLVILFHGVGSNGADMQSVARYLAPGLPDVTFSTPDGTAPFEGGGPGYQWFSIQGVTPDNRAQRIIAARAAFDKTIQGILQQYNVTPGEDNLILGGFSQGAIMALDVLVSGRLPLSGVVSLSGRLASPLPDTPLPEQSALLVHGKADPVIPWQESTRAEERLVGAGVTVSHFFEEGIPHTITAAGLHHMQAFIRKQCA